ncbi:hypothetical protein P6F26_05655 [Roseibacterium sp. SDUM158017]|uniref:hypothetical protein n=1 Tax=Roseicyclus salinarum TaxID=3036773 RepID=UPI00241501E2|nr:hypothetical protein [Roseibacterium sp. SDUM158017]MDG4647922.1 hypothetical protein [Roseibacterium sp. SDUM158017]
MTMRDACHRRFMDIAKAYAELGERRGWDMPALAPYHCGPYRVALLLQDPGSPYTAGSGAQVTRMIGVRNPDPTARFLRAALDAIGAGHHQLLVLNSLPAFGMRINQENLRDGAELNSTLLRLSGVTRLVFADAIARKAQKFMTLNPDSMIWHVPHPSRRGLNSIPNGRDVFREAIREAFSAK